MRRKRKVIPSPRKARLFWFGSIDSKHLNNVKYIVVKFTHGEEAYP